MSILHICQRTIAIALVSSLTILATPQASHAEPSLDFEFLDCQEGDANLKIKMNRLSPRASSIYMDGFVRQGITPNGFGFYGEFADWVETPEYISLPVPSALDGSRPPGSIAATYMPRMGSEGNILDLRLYKQSGDRYKVILISSNGDSSGFFSRTLNSCQVKNLSFIKKILPDRSTSAIVCTITVEAPPAFTVLNKNWKNSSFSTVRGDRKCQ